MIFNSVEVFKKIRLLENEAALLRSIMSLEEIQNIIQANSFAKKLFDDAMKIRSELSKEQVKP